MKKTDTQRLTEIHESLEKRGRFLPNPSEQEKNILGCVILYKESCDSFFENITENPFYSEVNRLLYELCKEIYTQKKYPELTTLFDSIKKKDLGGVVFMADVIAYTNDTAPVYFEQHLSVVKECYLKRKLALTFELLVGECLLDEQPLNEILDGADNELLKIRSGDRKKEPKSLKQLIHHLEYEEKPYGLRTNYTQMDECIRNGLGFYGGDLVLIGARPSVGKTTYAINLAVKFLEQSINTLFFSSEMTNESVIKKIFECVSGVESWKLNARKYPNLTMNVDEHNAIQRARKFLENDSLYIDDSSGLTPLDIRARVARWKYHHDIKAIFVDYIQILKPVGNHTNRESEIRSISQALKEIAKEFNIVVFALSQLNRESNKRENKKPSVSDLRDSGSLEQDADVIMLPYDPKQTETGNRDATRELTIIIAKNREGYCTEIPFDFEANISRFIETNRSLEVAAERTKPEKKQYEPVF